MYVYGTKRPAHTNLFTVGIYTYITTTQLWILCSAYNLPPIFNIYDPQQLTGLLSPPRSNRN